MSYQSQRLSTIFALCFLLTLSPVGSSARLVRRASQKSQTATENRGVATVSQFRRQTTFDSFPAGSSSSSSSFPEIFTDFPIPTSSFPSRPPTSIPNFTTTPFSSSTSFPIFDDSLTFSSSSQTSPAPSASSTTTPSPPPVFSETSTGSTLVSTPTLFSTEGPQFGESRRSSPVLLIVLIVGIACLLSLCIAGFFLLRRKRRQRMARRENLKVEQPFGSEEGFHLIVETGPEPTSVIPFSGTPSTRRPPPPSPQQPSSLASLTVPTTKSAKSSEGLSPVSEYSPTTEYASPNSAVSQQSLLDQLSSLRAQIQQVEALARTQGLNPSSSGQSSVDESVEPPPEYDANLGNGNARSPGRIDEKGPLF